MGLVVLLGAGAVYVFWPPSDALKSLLRKYGFATLLPPSRLYPPGTIVALSQGEPVVIQVVCSQTASLGDSVVVPSSPTSNTSLIEKISRSFDLSSRSAGGLLEVKPSFKSVRHARLNLSNATISQLSVDQVLMNVRHRRPECVRAVSQYLGARRALSMITTTIRADVTLQVDFDNGANLTAEQKQALLKDLATTAGFGYSGGDSSSTTALGLDLGFRDDALWPALTNDTSLALLKADTSVTRELAKVTDSLRTVGGLDSQTAQAKAVVVVASDTIRRAARMRVFGNRVVIRPELQKLLVPPKP